MLRVVIAPDSFKGSVSATEAANSLAAGWLSQRPDDQVVCFPTADGGEGTLAAIAAARPDGTVHAVEVAGPDSAPVRARWLLLPDQTAIVELAESSGLPLMTRPDALAAHTLGMGQCMADALAHGARRLVVGLGGSASTDGGTGALRALGARFSDSRGVEVRLGGGGLRQLAAVDASRLISPPDGLTCLTDVTAPLLGEWGAARQFGPQKGASASDIDELEDGLARLSQVVGVPGFEPGDGAAGGAGYGLRVLLGASLVPGAAAVAQLSGLADGLADADVLITGEGRFDHTSLTGKVVGYLLDQAQARGVTSMVVAGQIAAEMPASAAGAVVSLSELAGGSAAALADPLHWLVQAGQLAAGRATATVEP